MKTASAVIFPFFLSLLRSVRENRSARESRSARDSYPYVLQKEHHSLGASLIKGHLYHSKNKPQEGSSITVLMFFIVVAVCILGHFL
jgi:hypothetical protein